MSLWSRATGLARREPEVRVSTGGYSGQALDNAIALISPQRALARVKARVALNLTKGFLSRHSERFKYDGASAGRRANGWYAPASDANVEAAGSLQWLRDRSRELIRNNPYAVKALESLVGHVVGTGITPKAATGSDKLDAIIDAEWPYFAENCDTPQRLDFYGMQQLVTRSMAESGETLIRFRPRLAKDNLRIPLQLQILEADFLDQSRLMSMENGSIINGVELDLIGRRVNYWLFNSHPGGNLNPRGGLLSQPVPASQVMHVYRCLRPGQVRGVPWLHPVMMALRDLDDYCDAERVRKKIEACVVAFVEQAEGISGAPLGVKSAADPGNDQPIESFEPGMVEYLKTGQKISFNNPQPSGGFRDYKTTELQGIASGIGVPYEQVSSDLSMVNYSSYRAGELDYRHTIEGYRWLTLIPTFCMPSWRRFIDTLVLLGKLPEPNYGVEWTAPRFESVDPVKDAEAILKQIRMGTLTLAEAIAQNGYDFMDQLLMIAKTNQLLDSLEIILDCDPRNTTLRGQEQPADTEERTPKSKAVPGTSTTSSAEVKALVAELTAISGNAETRGFNRRTFRS